MQLIFIGNINAAAPVPITNTIPVGGTQRIAVAGSSTEFGAPTSIVRLYVPNPTNIDLVSVTIKGNNGKLDNLKSFSLQLTNTTSPNSCNPNIATTRTILSGVITDGTTIKAPKTGTTSTITQYNGNLSPPRNVVYDVYCVKVDVNGSSTGDSPFYLTTGTSGALLGNAEDVDSGTGYSKDDLPGNGDKWSKVLTFATDSCSTIKTGSIKFFDLDVGKVWEGTNSAGVKWGPYKQGEIPISLTRAKGTVIEPVGLDSNDAIKPLNSTGTALIRTGSNIQMSVYPKEGNVVGFLPGWKYTLSISNLIDINTIKITLPYDQVYGAFGCPDNDPTGAIENCSYNSISRQLTIKGWAYDYNTVANAFGDYTGPKVNIAVNGVVKSDASTNLSYDQSRIDTWLTGTKVYGSPGNTPSRDGKYGWEVTFDATSYIYGGSYSISGKVENVGVGNTNPPAFDKALSINTAADAFVGNKIPARCLPSPNIGCTVISEVLEYGDSSLSSYRVKYTITNNTSVQQTVKVYSIIDGKYPEYTEVNATVNPNTTTPVLYSGKISTFTASTDIKNWSTKVVLRTNVSIPQFISDCDGSLNIIKKPYFKVTNGDLVVGASTDCNNPTPTATGNLYSWATPVDSAFNSANRKGANAQYVAQVFGDVKDFYSAGNISTNNKKYLTLANSDSTKEWGGGSELSSCLKNVYDETKNDTASSSSVTSSSVEDLNGLNTLPKQIELANSLSITGTSPRGFNGNLAVYVTGDVYVAGNIILNPGKFFALIVKGNIYISPSVTQLDGMYIAQDNGSGGTIYTCGTASFQVIEPVNLFNQCSNKLTFNGIVQAQSIKLHRTFGSLNGTAPGNDASEVFNGRPELYFIDNPFSTPSNPSTSTDVQYDNITNLPPLL